MAGTGKEPVFVIRGGERGETVNGRHLSERCLCQEVKTSADQEPKITAGITKKVKRKLLNLCFFYTNTKACLAISFDLCIHY